MNYVTVLTLGDWILIYMAILGLGLCLFAWINYKIKKWWNKK